jgi:O-succinylbenzoate synthase
VREGLIVRLTDRDGRVGYGEAAPIPGFTPETVVHDRAWLRHADNAITPAEIARIPVRLACLRWACACAQAMLAHAFTPPARIRALPVAALLPAGSAARAALARQAAAGYRFFKWKTATQPALDEFRVLDKLLEALPAGTTLRLDANGGLSAGEFAPWLTHLRALGHDARALEFLEQPLPPARSAVAWAAQRRVAAASNIPIALDESVAGLSALRRAARWPGPLVVKPSLLGDLAGFLRWRGRVNPDLVYSSAFETSVGLHAALWLAATDPRAGTRALGFGTLNAFADDGLQLTAHAPGPILTPAPLTAEDFAELWNRLPTSA